MALNFLTCLVIFSSTVMNLTLTATVAVVEYYPLQSPNLTAVQLLTGNAAEYVKILNSITATDLNLIVFPESTLNTGISNQDDIFDNALEIIKSENPCDSQDRYPAYIKTISCAAKVRKTYIVINTVSKSPCSPAGSKVAKSGNCKAYGYDMFNTDVVFDVDGNIVASYNKFNLFGEYELDKPTTPDEVTFTTDSDETFGIFTCFDILFRTPAQTMVEKGVAAFVFPTMWFSELPFLTALQAQQMWAYTHNVILLSAGANNPALGSGGTAVFLGSQGTANEEMLSVGSSNTLLYKWPTDKSNSEPAAFTRDEEPIDVLSEKMDNFELLVDVDVFKFTSSLLNTTNNSQDVTVCHNNTFCCNFTTKFSLNNSTPEKSQYVYHLVAYQGTRSFTGVYNGGLEVCALIACLNSSITSCGQRFSHFGDVSWPITFDEITVTATFEDTEDRTQYPNSLLSSIRPIDASRTVWTNEKVADGDFVKRSFSVTSPQNRLLAFGIYGRNFEWDSDPLGSGTSAVLRLGCGILVSLVVILKFL